MKDKRTSPRRAISRLAKIEVGSLLCGCLITDISEGGVRLYVEGVAVPETFVLLATDDNGCIQPRDCQVIWRLGHELGAKYVTASNGGERRKTTKAAKQTAMA
jgi:hypothetical protein